MSTASAVPRPLARVILAGFMGSGKSTVGRLLARRLHWRFADLDEVVEARQGLSVPAIFDRYGVVAFRQYETEALQELLLGTAVVIALGGGAPETPALCALLDAAPDTAIVHLHAPFTTLYDRCLSQARNPAATARPLLAERSAAELRYSRRLPLYSRLAHHVIDVELDVPKTVAEKILDQLAR